MKIIRTKTKKFWVHETRTTNSNRRPQKKKQLQTWKGSKRKTSKIATTRRRRWWERSSTKSSAKKTWHQKFGEKWWSRWFQKGDMARPEKLPSNLYAVHTAQNFPDTPTQQASQQTRSTPFYWPGRVSMQLSNCRSPGGIQIARTNEESMDSQRVARDGRLRRSFWYKTSWGNMEISSQIQRQQCMHMPAEKSHTDQRATVLTNKEGDESKIERETKQGDHLSSSGSGEKGVWESCWSTSSLTALSNLRFADDVLLFFHNTETTKEDDVRLQKECRSTIRTGWASFAKCRRVNIKITAASTQTTPTRLSRYTYNDVRLRHVGTRSNMRNWFARHNGKCSAPIIQTRTKYKKKSNQENEEKYENEDDSNDNRPETDSEQEKTQAAEEIETAASPSKTTPMKA